jgi:dGTPase
LQEESEAVRLSPYASRSAASLGRKHPAAKCALRTEFQKDRDRITHSKAFRRLMHKTQVFISPEGDHYRTRLTHTLEVAQIARTVSRALYLNEDLTEAIALGHDLGHTPFGHTGEEALDTRLPGGFRHNEQSVRVVKELEGGGSGLNLTAEVVDGILNHRTSGKPMTLEGCVVQISDKIAYMNHDIDDAVRSNILHASEIPRHITEMLGSTSQRRIDFLVHNLVSNSVERNEVSLMPDVAQVLRELRAFLFENVYANQLNVRERKKIQSLIGLLFDYYMKHPETLPAELRRTFEADAARAVGDYIAGMTDRYAQKRFSEIFMPAAWEA